MLEYVFFDRAYAQRFTEFLSARNIESRQENQDEMFMVCVPEDLDTATDQAIEDYYDVLMDEHERNDQRSDEHDSLHRVGVQYADRQGNVCQARVPADTINRLMQVLTLEEIQVFVQAIADEVEGGGQKRLCEMD